MAKNGLSAEEYRGWIDSSITIDGDIKDYISEFLLGSPAFGLSKKGRSLYEYYGYKNANDYESLLIDLTNGIDFQCFEKYEELKIAIVGSDNACFRNDLPSELIEFIYMYTGKVSDSDFYKRYFKTEIISKGKKKEKLQAEAKQRKSVVCADKLFYHLRNGLAHGCYSITKYRGETFLVLQDETKDKYISARMVLKCSTLTRWIHYLENRAENTIDNNTSFVKEIILWRN